jgi:hypothetical protein
VLAGQGIAGGAVDVRAGARRIARGQPLGDQRADRPRENVAAATGCQGRTADE